MKEPLFFISRHTPTDEQNQLVKKAGFSHVIHLEDVDAFDTDAIDDVICKIDSHLENLFEDQSSNVTANVCVVNAAIALTLAQRATDMWGQALICVWENEMRAKEGERPTFAPKALWGWRCFPSWEASVPINPPLLLASAEEGD